MEIIKIENLSFTYPKAQNKAIDGLSATIKKGEFVTVCGKSGCGKSTLLRLLKPVIAPVGELSGNILFEKNNLSLIDLREQTVKIGFVMQNPENQIVTDKVWHELAFGLESLGYPNAEIRTRVSEMASFFGIQNLFHKKVSELSGGQKQILNLASVMVMQPSVLILDEPTSQLDPIAAQNFIDTLIKINRETGTTIILAEHRLEETLAVSDRAIVMENGKIIADCQPKNLAQQLKGNEMSKSLPTASKVFATVENSENAPVTVREGREWLLGKEIINKVQIRKHNSEKNPVITLSDVWFRYEKNQSDILKGLNLSVNKGEFYAIVGGNGTGKTTALSVAGGLNKPYRGKVKVTGKTAILPQNPQSLFLKKTVRLDLEDIDKQRTDEVMELCEISGLQNSHPYDLSGGEQQRLALAKILLLKPEIILLDEPTKGFDAVFKDRFAQIIYKLIKSGVTVIMVSHDIEFCAQYADRCAMFFDGCVTSEDEPQQFFADKRFYTTSANRMARDIIPNAVIADDIIYALNGKTMQFEQKEQISIEPEKKINEKHSFNLPMSILFFVLFVLSVYIGKRFTDIRSVVFQILSVILLTISISGFVRDKKFDISRSKTKFNLFGLIFILIAVPLTVLFGVFYLEDRKYYFISLLIIIETILPFLFAFEHRKPKARELVVLSTLCAIGVAGRCAFAPLPQFKPVVAVVIISGICFGGEAGFLVGAVTAFLSNFMFGQGVWTPWQMLAFGIIGLLSGVFFHFVKKTRLSVCIFGGFATLVIYGGIMNPTYLIMATPNPSLASIIGAYIAGFPFDLVHAISTVFFLWFGAEPMFEKLERIKIKYGILK